MTANSDGILPPLMTDNFLLRNADIAVAVVLVALSIINFCVIAALRSDATLSLGVLGAITMQTFVVGPLPKRGDVRRTAVLCAFLLMVASAGVGCVGTIAYRDVLPSHPLLFLINMIALGYLLLAQIRTAHLSLRT